jgi:four helix bundle protein
MRPLLTESRSRHAAGQFLRCSAAVAANYRAGGLARSRKEFIAKLGVVIEEVDECLFWLGYLADAECPARAELTALEAEGLNLLRIFTASRNTARRNSRPASI